MCNHDQSNPKKYWRDGKLYTRCRECYNAKNRASRWYHERLKKRRYLTSLKPKKQMCGHDQSNPSKYWSDGKLYTRCRQCRRESAWYQEALQKSKLRTRLNPKPRRKRQTTLKQLFCKHCGGEFVLPLYVWKLRSQRDANGGSYCSCACSSRATVESRFRYRPRHSLKSDEEREWELTLVGLGLSIYRGTHSKLLYESELPVTI